VHFLRAYPPIARRLLAIISSILRIARGAFLATLCRMQADFPLRDSQTHAVIGAALEVHRELGCGFLEAAYQEALAIELADRDIPFEHEVSLRVRFKDRVLHSIYRVDFVCFAELLVEVKALRQITGVEQAQMINYLKAARAERGLILNFGGRSLECKRLVFSPRSYRIPEP
jgi:GxxExxY protein